MYQRNVFIYLLADIGDAKVTISNSDILVNWFILILPVIGVIFAFTMKSPGLLQ